MAAMACLPKLLVELDKELLLRNLDPPVGNCMLVGAGAEDTLVILMFPHHKAEVGVGVVETVGEEMVALVLLTLVVEGVAGHKKLLLPSVEMVALALYVSETIDK